MFCLATFSSRCLSPAAVFNTFTAKTSVESVSALSCVRTSESQELRLHNDGTLSTNKMAFMAFDDLYSAPSVKASVLLLRTYCTRNGLFCCCFVCLLVRVWQPYVDGLVSASNQNAYETHNLYAQSIDTFALSVSLSL